MTLAAFILSAVAALISILAGYQSKPENRPGYAPFLLVAIAVCLITWPWK